MGGGLLLDRDSGSSWEEVSVRDHLYGVGVTEVNDRQEKTQELSSWYSILIVVVWVIYSGIR